MRKLFIILVLLNTLIACKDTSTKEKLIKHVFNYYSSDAKKVSIAGSFNN